MPPSQTSHAPTISYLVAVNGPRNPTLPVALGLGLGLVVPLSLLFIGFLVRRYILQTHRRTLPSTPAAAEGKQSAVSGLESKTKEAPAEQKSHSDLPELVKSSGLPIPLPPPAASRGEIKLVTSIYVSQDQVPIYPTAM
ncbi:hypothetical protein K458DRAFT_383389 [Lentithecium fluviatile CBS 122367]|uniref:Uncharacterized protein n=1 Tax=Lentithecium fluviatile CBS 122367 TaxID=1168545 RepID=A0A6G1JJC6_9PLEO|nr:hypothetical protein K458DRAFT_383389 [Lentithecium fluviatile CBS 122367]